MDLLDRLKQLLSDKEQGVQHLARITMVSTATEAEEEFLEGHTYDTMVVDLPLDHSDMAGVVSKLREMKHGVSFVGIYPEESVVSTENHRLFDDTVRKDSNGWLSELVLAVCMAPLMQQLKRTCRRAEKSHLTLNGK